MNNLTVKDKVIYIDNQSSAVVADIERGAIMAGLPQRALARPIVPTLEQKEALHPTVVSCHSQLARGFVDTIDVIELYGPFAQVEFEMVRHPDPQIVIPLFITGDRLKTLYRALIENLQNWRPFLANLSDFNEEMNYQFEQICYELAPFVKAQYLKWFWQKMTVIINQPSTWYIDASNRTRQNLTVRRQRPQRKEPEKLPAHLLVLREQIRAGIVHSSVWDTAYNKWRYGTD